MNQKKRNILTMVIGVIIIVGLNLLVLYFFAKEKFQLTDFLGKWKLESSIECSNCVNLQEEIIIKNNNNFFIENEQLKISKRILIDDYNIPTDIYVCFKLNKERLIEEECHDTKETSTYSLIYQKSS